MRTRRVFASILLVALVALPALSDNLVPLEVIDETDDTVGERLIYAVKERIRQSNRFKLAREGSRFILIIRTIDPNKTLDSLRGASIVFNTDWLLYDASSQTGPVYITGSIGLSGSKVIDDTADSIVARTDKVLSERIR